MNIPLTRPWIEAEELEAVSEVLSSGWLTQGSRVTAFEKAVSQYVGANHAVACTSGTTALHIALLLSNIGPEDEVIVPSFTWITTANVVRFVGATPVFSDIDLETFNIGVTQIEDKISNRTKAIILVHQFGMPADIDKINLLGQDNKLLIIEDAAPALGSEYKGKIIGGTGNLACFSFHPRKVVTTGEGGMIVLEDSEQMERARIFINHGASISDLSKHRSGSVSEFQSEEFSVLGYNYRMTDLQGAIGIVQVKRLKTILELRKKRALRYIDAFSKMPYIILPKIPEYANPNWQTYGIRISENCPTPRDEIVQRLLDAGISCRPGYMACHEQILYQKEHPKLHLPVTDLVGKSLVILPLFPQMTDEEQEYVIHNLQLLTMD